MTADRRVERLRVKLTPQEKEAKAELLAKLCTDLTVLEEQKKASSADYSAQIKKLKADNADVVYDVRTGTEERDVEVEERPDWKERIVKTIRTDTGEIIFKRPMTDKEKQTRFDLYTRDDDDEPADDPNPRAH